jgi:flagellum-specific ATP synthase
MAAYKDKADLIAIGAYQPGTDALTDAAIAAREPIDAFLRQAVEDRSTAEQADAALSQLTLLAGAGMAEAAPLHAQPADPAGGRGEIPLHAAIPPLHIAA